MEVEAEMRENSERRREQTRDESSCNSRISRSCEEIPKRVWN